jgi:hypothetical protein
VNVCSASRADLSWTDDVLEQLAEVVRPARRRLAARLRAVGGQHVPARAARGERVGREDLDARLEQVVPVLMFFGLPLRTTNDDDRVGDDALVSGSSAQSRRRGRLRRARDVGLEREGDDVGLQAGLDGAALVAGGAVGLLKVTPLPAGRLLEGRDERSSYASCGVE